MPNTVHIFDYLAKPEESAMSRVIVLFGDEPFLKRLALKRLRDSLFNDADEEDPFATFEGKSAQWRDVLDELSTVSLFGGGRPRLVVIEDADPFVSGHRAQLEDYVANPKSTGVLVLVVDVWPSNTRLYKAIAQSGLQVACGAPVKARGKRKVLDEDRLYEWLTEWATSVHDVSLKRPAAQLLLELVGPQFGLLDQELAKLALFAGPAGQATTELVRDVVGGWRTKTTWELIDAAADGDAAEALRQLGQLLEAGEHPVALLGQIAWSLRRFATATRIFECFEREGGRIQLRDALEQAGFRKWPPQAMDNAQRQLRQLGRERTGQFYRWLLDTDLALKGSHSSPERARFVLEELILKMSRRLGPQPDQQPADSTT